MGYPAVDPNRRLKSFSRYFKPMSRNPYFFSLLHLLLSWEMEVLSKNIFVQIQHARFKEYTNDEARAPS